MSCKLDAHKMPSIFVTLLNVDPNADVNPLGNYLNIIDLYHTYVPFSNWNITENKQENSLSIKNIDFRLSILARWRYY